MSLKTYYIPIDLLIHVILKHVSYFDLDHILPCFWLTPKEIAQIKYKIYKSRLTITKCSRTTQYMVEGKLHREDGPAIDLKDGPKDGTYAVNCIAPMDRLLYTRKCSKNGI